eukprot:Seg316.1 transcript_id=Seg316.1/GoldUCD/mRNA.D3Y31 product="hypothetical protein" protein_id=Seg316.1/GoldUCD/D3Y31
MLFQELWSRGLQWDDKLPTDILSQWRSWKVELSDVNDIKIPRCFTANTGTTERVEIHGFGDAFPKAYGAAVYVRTVDMNGHINTKLVMSKSRVAPLKRVTLPRLELLASVINTRLVSFIAESMKREISQVVLWADSSIALYWIKGPSSKWKPFVANRVEEIQSKFSPDNWRYCPGKENPADCLTRGLTCKDLHQTEKWWTGPSWLSLPSKELPCNITANETVTNMACKESSKTVQMLATIESKKNHRSRKTQFMVETCESHSHRFSSCSTIQENYSTTQARTTMARSICRRTTRSRDVLVSQSTIRNIQGRATNIERCQENIKIKQNFDARSVL